jgi:serine/threonine protein kinase
MTEWKIGQVILGEYMIEKELGRGGMGCVWLVKSSSTGCRFAVKQALISDEKHRKAFLTELQTWIDLPEHPNIVPCRFFRTVADEIVIFADFVAGGSLADWIAKGKLSSLEQILDVAIQFAWGLHAIHERGLIHQDVKPGNVLMTPDGVPMITDFGLARARQFATKGSFFSPATPPVQQSMLVSSGGMTPAYASPEQRSGKPLSRKTDIWSWGVSILDIFMHGVSCPYGGHIAAEVLESFVANGRDDSDHPQMSEEIALVLKTCFTTEPPNRWRNVEQAAASLMSVYELSFKKSYGRENIAARLLLRTPDLFKRQLDGASWTDPYRVFNHIYAVRGQRPADRNEMAASDESAQAKALADLRAYDSAYELLRYDSNARTDANRRMLASVCVNKALVHLFFSDIPGALSCYDIAICEYESIMASNTAFDIATLLAHAIFGKANTLQGNGQLQNAGYCYQKAIALLESIVPKEQCDALLGLCYMHKGVNEELRHQYAEAELSYTKAMNLLKVVAQNEPTTEKLNILGSAYVNVAIFLKKQDRPKESLDLLDRAVKLYRSFMHYGPSLWILEGLSTALNEMAASLCDAGNWRAALELNTEAITILEQYQKLFPRQLRLSLARCYLWKADTVSKIGSISAAIDYHRKGVAILEKLVAVEGRTDLAEALALALRNMANDLADSEECLEALTWYEKASALYSMLVLELMRTELAGDWAWLRAVRANTLRKLGRIDQAVREARESFAQLDAQSKMENRRDLLEVKYWLLRQFNVSELIIHSDER